MDVAGAFGGSELHPCRFFRLATSRTRQEPRGVAVAVGAGVVAGGVLDVRLPGPAPFGRLVCGGPTPLDFDGVVTRVGERVGAAVVLGEVGEQL